MARKTVAMAALVAALGTISVAGYGQSPGPGGRGAFAGQGRGRGPGGPGGPGALMAMVRQLDLSDSQREQLRALAEEARGTGDPGSAVRDAERKLHETVLGEAADAGAIQEAKAAVNAAHAAELDQRIAMMQKVAQILTPAQRQQLLKLRPAGPPPRH